jgi:hypothetical protein
MNMKSRSSFTRIYPRSELYYDAQEGVLPQQHTHDLNDTEQPPSDSITSNSTSFSYTVDSGASETSASPVLFRSVTSLTAYQNDDLESSASGGVRASIARYPLDTTSLNHDSASNEYSLLPISRDASRSYDTSTSDMDGMMQELDPSLDFSTVSFESESYNASRFLETGTISVSNATEDVSESSPHSRLLYSPSSSLEGFSLNAQSTERNQDYIVRLPPPSSFSQYSPPTPPTEIQVEEHYRQGHLEIRPTTAEDYATAIMSRAWRTESPAMDFNSALSIQNRSSRSSLRNRRLAYPPPQSAAYRLPTHASLPSSNLKLTMLTKVRKFAAKTRRLFSRKGAGGGRRQSFQSEDGPFSTDMGAVEPENPHFNPTPPIDVLQYHGMTSLLHPIEDEPEVRSVHEYSFGRI